ncbi:protein Bouncer-like [Morone saxatilis]|uniref:protein Bouncer-like n=1 Tax=Morone saxatilis TaxID=34816 RepID=UPI0015E23279|nr:protein Bouncer-like [Morone saxatilis]
MNKYLWSCAAILTLFVTVESLTCNTCDLSVLGSCFFDSPVSCNKNQTRCYIAVANIQGLLNVHARGCTVESDCKNQTGLSILTYKYNITRSCCSTNLCNGAASIQLPLTAALGAALVALWSQWGL